MSDSGEVVGTIEPGDDGPVFRIIDRNDRPLRREVRACEHGEFEIDERWTRIHCGRCGAEVEPFDVLLRYAEWYEHVCRERDRLQQARVRLERAELQRLKRMRHVSPKERKEIETVLRRGYSMDQLEELEELRRRIDDERRRRKYGR